jgi:hypothetical protein
VILQWVSRLEGLGVPLHNPPALLRWNSRKTYLAELQDKGWSEAAGKPPGVTVPRTVVVPAGSSVEAVRGLLEAAGLAEEELVVKPVVGASGVGAVRGRGPGAAVGRAEEVLVQEFLPEVAARGEYSLIFFGGQFSHAVRKVNTTGDFRVQGQYGGSFEPAALEGQEGEDILAFATSVLRLAGLPDNLLYARSPSFSLSFSGCRVDLTLAGLAHTPTLMELELFEPALFTGGDQAAGRRLAQALWAAIGGRGLGGGIVKGQTS